MDDEISEKGVALSASGFLEVVAGPGVEGMVLVSISLSTAPSTLVTAVEIGSIILSSEESSLMSICRGADRNVKGLGSSNRRLLDSGDGRTTVGV